MDVGEYQRMALVEDHMWWYRAVHASLLDALQQHGGLAARTVMDAGCGTGGLLRHLAPLSGRALVFGLDADPQACALARAREVGLVVQGTVDHMPFAAATIDVMFSVDVLSHGNVDPFRALCEARRCLRPGGLLLMNLPAYGWMRSAHDRRVHNVRRFTRGKAGELVEAAGLRIARLTYWNSLLFPLMALHRLLTRGGSGPSDVRPFPVALEWLFHAVTVCERRLIARGVTPGFGGSILVVAVRS